MAYPIDFLTKTTKQHNENNNKSQPFFVEPKGASPNNQMHDDKNKKPKTTDRYWN
jgi:hypothetical protein